MNSLHKQEGFEHEKIIIVPDDFFSSCSDHPLVKPLFVTDIGFFPSAQHHHRERNNGIGENILIYCLSGAGTIRIPGQLIKLNAGEVFCIPAGTGHTYSADKNNPWSILWVHFKGESCSLYPLHEKRAVPLGSAGKSNTLQYFFTLLIDTLEHGFTIGNFIYSSQLMTVILSEVYLKDEKSDIDKQNRKLTKVIRYMISHLDRELTLDELSSEMHLSKSYLNSIFRKHTSRSPMDYWIHLKMQQACKDLKMTDMLIYEVSQKLGYKDPCYFSRLFKKVTGVSPREYQKQNRGVVTVDNL